VGFLKGVMTNGKSTTSCILENQLLLNNFAPKTGKTILEEIMHRISILLFVGF